MRLPDVSVSDSASPPVRNNFSSQIFDSLALSLPIPPHERTGVEGTNSIRAMECCGCQNVVRG